MERLWAPWRMKYIKDMEAHENEGCVFCSLPQNGDDKKVYILYRGRKNYVVMNKYPYNNGHLLIVPYLHTGEQNDLDDSSALELWKLTGKCKKVLEKAFNPDGFNIGMNVGRVAGAGIEQHIHMHIVPRWNGDTNFMPVVGDVKVVSQGLEDAYDQLLPHFHSEE